MRDVSTGQSEKLSSQERFRESNLACARSLASDPQLPTTLGDNEAALTLGVQSPTIDILNPAQQNALLRGMGDALAVVGAFHDAELHKTNLPTDTSNARLFNAMERVRCEALGSIVYQGVARNLAWIHRQTHSAQNVRSYSGIEQLELVLGCLAHESITGVPTPPHTEKLVNYWRAAIQTKTDGELSALAQLATDQGAYAQHTLKLIELVDVKSLVSDNPDTQAEAASTPKAQEEDDEADDTQLDTSPQADVDTEAAMEKAAADAMREELEEQRESINSAADDAELPGSTHPNKDAPVSQDGEASGNAELMGGEGYQVFSADFDEVVNAADLSTDAELDELRSRLDEQIDRHNNLVGRLSGRLQRVLMAEQQRHWQFDLDEGVLDTSRLTRIVTQPLSSLSFKAESDIQFRDTTITLLVDNSKSMLGKPITIAASCADLLARTLERCGVTVEILGFTTTELHGGQTVEQWQQNGARPNPGRLNGLRHIIYKSADVSYRNSRKGLGLMLRGDILKQNIDGEALLWAHSRLVRRPEQRKILMMISDGAPIDTSTMSANPKNYLVNHLHKVIATIKKQDQIELVAIGIGHDVSAYYDKSITIYDVRKLGRAMLSQLTQLFREDGKPKKAA